MTSDVQVASAGQACVLLVQSERGLPGRSAFAQQAARGERPRKDYVELADALQAEVIDSEYMATRATAAARLLARFHFTAAQILETFVRRRFRRVVAWGDRYGLALAFLLKLTGSRRDVILIASWLSPPSKAVFLRKLRVQSHLRAILLSSGRQMAFAAEELGIPRAKLHRYPIPVDERFWRPVSTAPERLICAAGVEGRDYTTLVEAVRGLDVALELGVATREFGGAEAARQCGLDPDNLPKNVRLSSPSLSELRSLYARSLFVVVPLVDVDYDSGSSVATEAMAMGKAVIMTRTRGQTDLIRHGETGLSVPPGDPAALRAAIEQLLNDPIATERIGQAARVAIEERHAMDQFVAHVGALVANSDRS